MTTNYKELKSLFISDPSNAITECQNIICSVTSFNSFRDFYNYHLEHSHVSTCQNEWPNPQMSVHCTECAINPQSCFCLQCFLNSNHEGHDYLVRTNSVGNCDCGDLTLWKRSGFCSKHYGLEDDSHPEDYLDEKLRTTLTDIVFKAAFSAINHLQTDDGQKISPIIQFLKSFLKFGDGFRRLLAISLTEKINFEKLLNSIFDATAEFNKLLQHFCGLLVNDQIFKNNFSTVNYKLMINRIIPDVMAGLTSKDSDKPYEIWESFWFHSYQLLQFKYNIDKYNWDWVNFGVSALNYTKEFISVIGNEQFNDKFPTFLYDAINLKEASTIQPGEQTQKLFDQLFSQVLQTGTAKGIKESVNDTIISTSFKEKTQDRHFSSLYYFDYIFYKIFESFKSKKELKFDKLFEEFDKSIDISPIFMIGKNIIESGNMNENDKFVSKYIKPPNSDQKINDNNYKSFHNGASFFINHPMHTSFLYLLRNDNMTRIKIARFLTQSKYQSLRVQLGILTLKRLLSYVCLNQNLVSKSNFGAISSLTLYINNPKIVDCGIPLLFPALQLLIGLQNDTDDFSLKEFFAFEMAREIGLFDDYSKEDYEDEDVILDQKQMIFTFFYLSILLVIERTLFNFNGHEFIKEQIIFGLKNGVSNLDDLKDMFDIKVASQGRYMVEMNNIVSEVATARQKKTKNNEDQGVLFDLKEGIEFKNISAINPFNTEKVIMNNQISKNPDELLKIQNFEPEETYFFPKEENNNEIDSSGLNVRLKDFLLTPTVLAVIYHTLRSDSEKVELNDHLAMNILVLISKYVQNDDNSETSFDDKTVINYSTLDDLIAQLKRIVFDFKVDDKNNSATIKNNLTRKAFNCLLKVKIGSGEEQPKSFIEILIEKGEIGKSVLGQMSVEFEGSDEQKEKQDIKKLKKLRAQKMKEDILNHYKSITSNFNVNDLQNSNDLLTPSNSIECDACSVCSQTKKDELLSYPIYFYRTKFPFIIDKQPIVQLPMKEAVKETEVFEDEQFLEELGDDFEDELENEQELEDPEVIFTHFMETHPTLALTDDLTDEQLIQRQALIRMIRDEIYNKYTMMLSIIEARKKARENKKKLREELLKKEEMKNNLENPDLIVSKQITPGNVFVIQFGICQHLVHPNCINKNRYECPVDRTAKNGFLPNIDDLSKDEIFTNEFKLGDETKINKQSLSPNLISSIDVFFKGLNEAHHASENKIVDNFIELIKSISGLISTYEIRLRTLPDCLDSRKSKILPRNLFLSTWYGYRINEKPPMKTGFKDSITEDVEPRMTVFQRFIKKLIECDEIELNVEKKNQHLNQFVSNLVKELKSEKEICLFLRRVCLADHFLLQKDQLNDVEFIDWDEILSAENLSKKYNVQFKSLDVSNGEEFEFKPFVFSILPKEFLRLAQSPYNLPVDQTQSINFLNILDYNFLIKNYSDFEQMDQKKIDENYKNCAYHCDDKKANSFFIQNFSYKRFPTVLLSIGSSASSVYVIDQRQIAFTKPFYVDRYGCPDIGFRRNQPLFLNEDIFERVMDEILSGDYSNSLQFLLPA